MGGTSRASYRRGKSRGAGTTGKLRIGDNWNAITIIALSQSNPLKAIAEFVENSIDARARNVTIIRGKERGESYLNIVDDGEGVPRDADGMPDFRYVATHIGDSLKRRLKAQGIQGIQGEFGIGLLSFWTVGERMVLSSAGTDGRTYQMEMKKDEPGYTIIARRVLFSHPGTELLIRPLLPGLRQLSGEKIQNYLASELRDRIRKSDVRIRILDRGAKKELEVQPRQFTGRLLHHIDTLTSPAGEIYLELYLNNQSPDNHVSLFRAGTRVMDSVAGIDSLNIEPWNSGFLQGMVDAPFLHLTPGTRSGVIQDENFDLFRRSLETIHEPLLQAIAEEKTAQEELASHNILKSVQRAFREAFLTLPPEDYQWFSLHTGSRKAAPGPGGAGKTEEGAEPVPAVDGEVAEAVTDRRGEEAGAPGRDFFEFAGPLYSAVISPGSAVVKVQTEKGFRCIARDKSRRVIDTGIEIRWRIREGAGQLSSDSGEIVRFLAPEEPGLTILEAEVTQGDTTVVAQSIVTISQELIEKTPGTGAGAKGLPGYTFLRAPGELWRSRYDEKNNLVVVNNGHRDYVYAAQKPARKLKYICRLFAKELVLANFPGFDRAELMERMIELSLYAEEYLK